MDKHIKYIVWQNKSFKFYLASRVLYFKELGSPSSFCAVQAMELLLKATMFYYVNDFNPLRARHNMKSLVDELANMSIIKDRNMIVPWLLNESTYYMATRYDTEKKTVPIYTSFLRDIDVSFYNVLALVPFQVNSILANAVKKGKKSKEYLILRRNNATIKQIKEFFISLHLLPSQSRI
jgi:HEPN domain-containing protein